jgi:hypothetical protein
MASMSLPIWTGIVHRKKKTQQITTTREREEVGTISPYPTVARVIWEQGAEGGVSAC